MNEYSITPYNNSLHETKDAFVAYLLRRAHKAYVRRGKTGSLVKVFIKDSGIKPLSNVFDEWRDEHLRDLMKLLENDPVIQDIYTDIKTFKLTLRRDVAKFFKMRVVKRKDFYDSMRRFLTYHLTKTHVFDDLSAANIQAKMQKDYNYKVSAFFVQKIIKELESTHSLPIKAPLKRSPKSVQRMKEIGKLILFELLDIKSKSHTHTAKKIIEELPEYKYWKPNQQMIQIFLDGDEKHISSYYKYMKYKNLKKCLAYAYINSEEKI